MKRGLDVDSFGKIPASSNVELALFQSTAMGSHSHVLKMPWELNPTLTSLFSGNNTPWLNGVKVPRLLPSVSSSSCSTQTMDMDSKRSLIRTFCFRAAARRDDAERAQVILKWVELILLCPTASTVGLQLIAEKVDAVNSDKCFLVVSDALVPKSKSTLKTRAGSLALYVKWLESKHPGEKYLPFCESKVYDYMCDLRTAACAASRGSTFVSTLGFVGELLGMQGTEACISSGRVKGASLDVSGQAGSSPSTSTGAHHACHFGTCLLLWKGYSPSCHCRFLRGVCVRQIESVRFKSFGSFVWDWWLCRRFANAREDGEDKGETMHFSAGCDSDNRLAGSKLVSSICANPQKPPTCWYSHFGVPSHGQVFWYLAFCGHSTPGYFCQNINHRGYRWHEEDFGQVSAWQDDFRIDQSLLESDPADLFEQIRLWLYIFWIVRLSPNTTPVCAELPAWRPSGTNQDHGWHARCRSKWRLLPSCRTWRYVPFWRLLDDCCRSTVQVSRQIFDWHCGGVSWYAAEQDVVARGCGAQCAMEYVLLWAKWNQLEWRASRPGAQWWCSQWAWWRFFLRFSVRFFRFRFVLSRWGLCSNFCKERR